MRACRDPLSREKELDRLRCKAACMLCPRGAPDTILRYKTREMAAWFSRGRAGNSGHDRLAVNRCEVEGCFGELEPVGLSFDVVLTDVYLESRVARLQQGNQAALAL